MSKKMLIHVLVLVVLGAVCQVQADTVYWDGEAAPGDNGWNRAENWDTDAVPGSGDNVVIDAGVVEIYLPQDQNSIEILSLYTDGEISLGAWGINHLTFTITDGLTNYGELEIDSDGGLNLYTTITNKTGAYLELENVEIIGTLINEPNATAEMYEVYIEGAVYNSGNIEIDSFSEMWVEGEIDNDADGVIQLYGGESGSETAIYNAGTIKGFGLMGCDGDGGFFNSGEILAEGGVLLLYVEGTLDTTDGTLTNQFVSSLQIMTMEVVDNHGTMDVRSGGGIAIYNDLNNQSDGIINLMGGTLAASGSITQSSGATFSGFGTIATQMGLTIEDGATIELTGPTSIYADVTIDSGGTLIIRAGQTIITGATTNNGTILQAGGTILQQGVESGYGETVYATPPFESLVSHWQMDDNADNTQVADSTGNNDGATQQNTNGMHTSGVVGNALSFNGITDYIDIGSNPIPSSGDWTLAGWVYCEGALGTTDDWATAFGSASWTGSVKGVQLYIKSGNLRIALGNGSTYREATCVAAITSTNADKWHHVAAVYDSGSTEAKVYVNGTYVRTISQAYAQSNTNFAIGRSHGLHTPESHWYGKIDNVSIFNEMLTDSDIEEMYNEAVFLVGHWKLDDNAASTDVVDSASSNTGTAQQNTNGMSISGVVGEALAFNGSTDYIDISSNPIPSSGDWTLAGWIRCEGVLGTTDDWATAFGSASWTSSVKGVQLYIKSGNLRIALGDGSSYREATCVAAITSTNANTWYHTAVVYDSANMEAKVYVDGAYSLTIGQAYAQSNADFTIGKSLGLHTSESYWYGMIDEVKIFNEALPASEVDALYNE